MTPMELKEKVLSKYKVGQTVKIKIKDGRAAQTGTSNAEIIKFYPHHILCKMDNCLESFTYYDFLTPTTSTKHKPKSKKSGHKGITWNKANKKWVITLWIDGKSNYIGINKDLSEAVKMKEDYLRGINDTRRT